MPPKFSVQRRGAGWLLGAFLATLPILAVSTHWLPRWAVMWLLAGATFQGLKLFVWWRRGGSLRRLLEWCAWPGMDPQPFLRPRACTPTPPREWGFAFAKMSFGAVLLWIVARLAPNPIAAGWIGMAGLIFLLHFGAIHLLALVMRRRGRPVQTLMHNPIAAVTLADFWGRRWNRGFSDLARREVFAPLAPRLGASGAALAVFLFSGYVHELAITVPAGAGYGWPTLYFLGQGFGTLWQRAHPRWSRGWRGRLLTLVLVAVPAFWLFPPVFVERVMIPFFQVIHAL